MPMLKKMVPLSILALLAAQLAALDLDPSRLLVEHAPLVLPACYLSDLPTALKRAEEEGKPVLQIVLGGEFCPWSERIRGEILASSDFVAAVRGRFVLLVTSESSVQGVGHFPMLRILDAKGAELFHLGYLPLSPQELAENLWQRFCDYRGLEELVAGQALESLPELQLMSLYERAQQLGHEVLSGNLLDVGVARGLESCFWEKYGQLLRSVGGKSSEAKRWKRELLARFCKGSGLKQRQVRARLALLEFERAAEWAPSSSPPSEVAAPLMKFIRKEGWGLPELWRLELSLAQFFYGRGRTALALTHAERALSSAPDEEKPLIQELVALLSHSSSN